jgi:mannose-6-phosphate isomerase-like protein (cupin superfamily)
MAQLVIPSEKFLKCSFRPDEIDGGDERTLPELFEPGSGMRRFTTPDDRELRAGFTRLKDSQEIKTFFWYKEIWYVISGTAELTVTDKRTGETVTETLEAQDAVYYPEGVRIVCKNESGDDFYFLYCAVPASNRDARWLAVMDEEDINDVRIRREYDPE